MEKKFSSNFDGQDMLKTCCEDVLKMLGTCSENSFLSICHDKYGGCGDEAAAQRRSRRAAAVQPPRSGGFANVRAKAHYLFKERLGGRDELNIGWVGGYNSGQRRALVARRKQSHEKGPCDCDNCKERREMQKRKEVCECDNCKETKEREVRCIGVVSE